MQTLPRIDLLVHFSNDNDDHHHHGHDHCDDHGHSYDHDQDVDDDDCVENVHDNCDDDDNHEAPFPELPPLTCALFKSSLSQISLNSKSLVFLNVPFP